MPVQVPFHLMRREQPDACAAVLLLATEIEEILALCGRLSLDPLPAIFPVANGFLVIPEEVPTLRLPKTIRLRRLSENCYLPVDADLTPALHPEEVVDLTRRRGLVFLPGAQCLAFDPDQPLPALALIKFGQLKRDAWQPFPDGPELAGQLTLITRVVPEITPDDILNQGGSGIAETPPPPPPKSGALKTAAGKMAMGLGKGIAAIGTVLGMGALARLGAALIGAAVGAVPRLSEALLGKQEAALRELLRKFREGKTDEALQNALPMGGNKHASNLHNSDQLPTHDTRWSLASLFGSGGAANLWVGGQDVHRELADEYRKAAQAALARGDHRRAAFIYCKLLGELRTAADILAKGGLHRDAAILFRDLLKEPRWAAREFEAANEFDEALRLYRLVGDHEQAGDLLRRLGEEEQAIEEYHEAARKMVEERRDYLKAGDLMLRKTGRPDLAGGYFALGWRERGRSLTAVNNAVPCAVRLAEIYAFAEPFQAFWDHLDEVEVWLTPGNVPDTMNFFNTIAKLSDLPHLTVHRAEMRDRSKLALAAKLREHPQVENRAGSIVSDLFGASGLWPAALVSDANYALRQALNRRRPAEKVERPLSTIRLGNATVTAAAFSESGEILVGLSNGEVIAFQPQTGQSTLIAPTGPEFVEAIAIDAHAQNIVVASGFDPDDGTEVRLRSFRRTGLDQVEPGADRVYRLLGNGGWYCLNPIIKPECLILKTLLSTPAGIIEFNSMALIPYEPLLTWSDGDNEHPPTCLLLPIADGEPQHGGAFVSNATVRVISSAGASIPIDHEGRRSLIVFEDRRVIWSGTPFFLGWQPRFGLVLYGSLSWLRTSREQLELAGIADEEGTIYWSDINAERIKNRSFTLTSQRTGGYRAVAIWKPGMIIGVTGENRVCWLRAFTAGFQEWATSTNIPIPTKAVACFPCHATGEVMVILADGELVRISVPL